jgi:flagellar motor switch/type III secretory pathway protein FliN
MDLMHGGQDNSKSSFRLREFDETNPQGSRPNETASAGLQSRVTIVLGRARLTPAEANSLHTGSLVVLEQETAEPVEFYSAGQLLGRGTVEVIDDKFCVRVVELYAAEQAA